MDGFTDNFVGETPEAEFLAREKDQLAGLEDDLAPTDGGTDISAVVPDNENGIGETTESIDELNGFEKVEENPEAAVLEEPKEVKPTYTISPVTVREVPEKIKIWKEKQEKLLEEKDAKEEKTKQELREKATKELAEWYKQHEEQVAKTRQANRSAEKELVADMTKMEPGTEWERIAKLCDFNPKTAKSSRDISRMRSIILQVKQSPPIKS